MLNPHPRIHACILGLRISSNLLRSVSIVRDQITQKALISALKILTGGKVLTGGRVPLATGMEGGVVAGNFLSSRVIEGLACLPGISVPQTRFFSVTWLDLRASSIRWESSCRWDLGSWAWEVRVASPLKLCSFQKKRIFSLFESILISPRFWYCRPGSAV